MIPFTEGDLGARVTIYTRGGFIFEGVVRSVATGYIVLTEYFSNGSTATNRIDQQSIDAITLYKDEEN
jgi:hypothetical protein